MSSVNEIVENNKILQTEEIDYKMVTFSLAGKDSACCRRKVPYCCCCCYSATGLDSVAADSFAVDVASC